MALTAQHEKKIADILSQWNEVQGRLKRAEQISQLAIIPAINEIRYAGRMLVAALSNQPENNEIGVPNIDKSIIIAEQYLRNADHDISDALIYYFQNRVDEINRSFGAKAVINEYPEYKKLLESLKQCRQLVIESRSKLSSRDDNYMSIRPLIEGIIDNYFLLDKADVFMSIRINRYKRSIRTYQLTIMALIIIIFITFLFAAPQF